MWLTGLRASGVRGLPVAVAALLWALAAGSAALWSLQMPRSEDGVAAVGVAQEVSALPAAEPGAIARALGHAGQATAAADEQRRFQLLGVIAAPTGQGSALLAVDGQPARAFVQGQTVADGWRLQFVRRETVRLSAGPDGAVLELSLPGVDSRSSRE